MLSSGLCGQQACAWFIDIHAGTMPLTHTCTHTHTLKKKITNRMVAQNFSKISQAICLKCSTVATLNISLFLLVFVYFFPLEREPL